MALMIKSDACCRNCLRQKQRPKWSSGRFVSKAYGNLYPAIFATLQVNVNYTFKDNLLKVSRSLSIDNSPNVASSDWKRVLHGIGSMFGNIKQYHHMRLTTW